MSASAPHPATSWPAVLRGLRTSVQAGTLSWWRALGVVAAVVVWVLMVVGTFVVCSVFVALIAVEAARIETGPRPQPSDPAVLVVAISLGVTTLVAIAAAAWWHQRRVAQRQARMQWWADTHGWAYAPHSSVLSSRWSAPGIPRTSRATDVLTRATPSGEVVSLTLESALETRRSSRHAAVAVGPRWFPTLSLTPTTGLDRAAQALGGQDITVESHDINERWRMRCTDTRFAHEVLHPRLLERLDRAGLPGLCLLVEGRDVVVHVPGATTVGNVEPLADLVLDLAALLPSYLPDDYPQFAPDVPRRQRRRAPRRRERPIA